VKGTISKITFWLTFSFTPHLPPPPPPPPDPLWGLIRHDTLEGSIGARIGKSANDSHYFIKLDTTSIRINLPLNFDSKSTKHAGLLAPGTPVRFEKAAVRNFNTIHGTIPLNRINIMNSGSKGHQEHISMNPLVFGWTPEGTFVCFEWNNHKQFWVPTNFKFPNPASLHLPGGPGYFLIKLGFIAGQIVPSICVCRPITLLDKSYCLSGTTVQVNVGIPCCNQIRLPYSFIQTNFTEQVPDDIVAAHMAGVDSLTFVTMGGVGSAFPATDIPIISTVPDLLAFLDELHYRTRYELGEDWVGSLFMDIQASDIDRITSVLTNYFDPLRRVPTFNNICFFRNATSGTTPITFHLINTADIFRNDIYSKIIVSPSPFHHQICADSPVGKDILRAVPTEETFINLKHRVLLVASPGRSGTPLVVPILTPPRALPSTIKCCEISKDSVPTITFRYQTNQVDTPALTAWLNICNRRVSWTKRDTRDHGYAWQLGKLYLDADSAPQIRDALDELNSIRGVRASLDKWRGHPHSITINTNTLNPEKALSHLSTVFSGSSDKIRLLIYPIDSMNFNIVKIRLDKPDGDPNGTIIPFTKDHLAEALKAINRDAISSSRQRGRPPFQSFCHRQGRTFLRFTSWLEPEAHTTTLKTAIGISGVAPDTTHKSFVKVCEHLGVPPTANWGSTRVQIHETRLGDHVASLTDEEQGPDSPLTFLLAASESKPCFYDLTAQCFHFVRPWAYYERLNPHPLRQLSSSPPPLPPIPRRVISHTNPLPASTMELYTQLRSLFRLGADAKGSSGEEANPSPPPSPLPNSNHHPPPTPPPA
jgi:hypothetical protein